MAPPIRLDILNTRNEKYLKFIEMLAHMTASNADPSAAYTKSEISSMLQTTYLDSKYLQDLEHSMPNNSSIDKSDPETPEMRSPGRYRVETMYGDTLELLIGKSKHTGLFTDFTQSVGDKCDGNIAYFFFREEAIKESKEKVSKLKIK